MTGNPNRRTPASPSGGAGFRLLGFPVMEDTLIAGAGPIGLASAVSAKRHGADPLVIDAGPVVHSVVRYPIGMTFFTTPDKIETRGRPPRSPRPRAHPGETP